MVAYDYLLVELNFGAAFLCNLNHFIHASVRWILPKKTRPVWLDENHPTCRNWIYCSL